MEPTSQREKKRKKIEVLAANSLVLECDTDTARYYGELKSLLKLNGTPIPENDIWIAAIAKQHQLVLITRDKHFNSIDVISIESW
jgi:tRNA(fMet)-specific endonuclease VapC